MSTITLKTETEHLLFKHLTEEQEQRKQLEGLVKHLNSEIEALQLQLKRVQEKIDTPAIQPSTKEAPQIPVQYETDEEELANETQWIRHQHRKKRKMNQSLTPPRQDACTSADQEKRPKTKKIPQPPPIIVEKIKNYQKFYDFLCTSVSGESFFIKMKNDDCVKVNAKNEETYKAITKLLLQNNCHWHSYENKQDRPIRIMAKSLHSSYAPARIIEDLSSKGYKILEAVNKLSWRDKKPLNMFTLSFNKDEDVNKIYAIKSILGCKVEIEPLKSSKLIPQCKRCQAYGHTQKYCSKEPRCVKCTGKHLTKDCTKPAEVKPKCVHCGEAHPASYRGCMVAKELQNLKNKTNKKEHITPSNQAAKANPSKINMSKVLVTKGHSFAQATKGIQVQELPQQQPQPQQHTQPKLSLDSKVNKILSILTSFDDRLKKLEQNAFSNISK